MQLDVARLCMDCDEVHDAQMCPMCGSETFAYITRWIPAPETRKPEARRPPRPAEPSSAAATYRELLSPQPHRPGVTRWLRRGAVGLAALTAFGWAWQRNSAAGAVDNGSEGTRNPPPRS